MVAHRALVTGGSRGIGAAIVIELRRRGFEVLAPTRDELDLLSPPSIEAFLSLHADSGIDVLVNNAGINRVNSITDIKVDDWAAMLQVNLTAPAMLSRGLVSTMMKRRWGRVVNISSVFGVVTREKRSAYSATKAGLNGLTRTLAVELGPYGVLVNAVCPGYVDTELTHKNNSPSEIDKIVQSIPLERLALPAEVARFVGFLCSDENSYLTGQTLIVDGGFSCR